MILAAIDIGSNAARLLISEVSAGAQFKTIGLTRIALGLGFDVFGNGYVSPEREEMLIKAMQSFSQQLQEHKVTNYRAYATAAMRAAKNSEQIIANVFKQSGIRIELITGEQEAEINFLNQDQHAIEGSGLFIDVGGGSTEITLFKDKNPIARRSFQIGAIRVFKEQITDQDWSEMQEFLTTGAKDNSDLKAYGTGGSISKLFSIAGLEEGAMMPTSLLDEKLAELAAVSKEERMSRYLVEPDRAELIIPALGIFSRILKMTGVPGIYAFRAGLASGMIRALAKELMS